MKLTWKHYAIGGVYLVLRAAATYGAAWALAALQIIPAEYVTAIDSLLWGVLLGNVIGQMQRQPQYVAGKHIE